MSWPGELGQKELGKHAPIMTLPTDPQ